MTAARLRLARAGAALAAVVGLAGGCTFSVRIETSAAAVATARPGGVVTVAITPPGTIDPTHAAHPASLLVTGAMCDTLVNIDPVSGHPRAGLAESWTVADGGRSISFRLRKGARFHDGSKVTSKEVVDSLRRLADPATGSPAASLLADLAGYEKLATATADDIRLLLRGVRAIEPLSFEVLFERGRHPDFVRALAHPATAPIRADLADKAPAEFGAAPVCSGPYKAAAPFAPGATEIKLVRSSDARRSGATPSLTRSGLGYADEIRFRVFETPPAAYDAWARGEVDVAAVPPERLAAATAAAKDSGAVAVGPAPAIEFIGVPAGERSPFKSAAARRALADALDREAIVREVYEGSRAPATGFLPPALGVVARPDACGFGRPGGPAPPRAEFAGKTVTLAFNDEFRHRRLAEAVAGQWREKLGLDVQLVPLGWDDFLSKLSGGTGADGLFRTSWKPRYASGLEYLGPLFLSPNSGGTNLARFSDVEFDRAFELRAAAAVEEPERDIELRVLEDRLCREVPLIPVAFGQSAVAIRPERLASARKDGRLLALSGAPLLREMYVK